MLLLPIGCDSAGVKRQAYVTYAIIALNVLVFLTVCIGNDPYAESELITKWQTTIAFMQDRPYLHAPPSIVTLLPKRLADRPVENRNGVPDWRIASEQRTLDAMAQEVRTLYDDARRIRWSFVPALGSFTALMSSIFVHAGLMHLLGNMFFLFATGPVVEEALGKPLYALLYFLGGIAATAAFALRHPEAVIPVMGASGAIAAVMGAFLVRFIMSRIEFIWIPIIFVPKLNVRFFVPAFVVLPLWLLSQLAAIPFEGESGGVAVTAHIAGFTFGVAFALVEKVMSSMPSQKKTKTADDPRRASIDQLRQEVDRAFEARDDHALDSAAARLLGMLNDMKLDGDATDLVHDLAGPGSDRRLPVFVARAASFAEKRGDRRSAVELYKRLTVIDENGPRALPSLMKLGSLLRSQGDISGAREALLRARSHRTCTDAWIPKIEAGLTELGDAPGDLAGETPWT